MDIIEKFPVTSNRGNKYLSVIYDYGSIDILVITTKPRTDKDFLRVFNNPNEHLLTRGIKPAYMCMDN